MGWLLCNVPLNIDALPRFFLYRAIRRQKSEQEIRVSYLDSSIITLSEDRKVNKKPLTPIPPPLKKKAPPFSPFLIPPTQLAFLASSPYCTTCRGDRGLVECVRGEGTKPASCCCLDFAEVQVFHRLSHAASRRSMPGIGRIFGVFFRVQ